MNEKIEKGQEMIPVAGDMRKTISTILERMLLTRPKKQVNYRPYQACEAVKFTGTLGSQQVDLEKMYPEAKNGEGAIVDFQIVCGGDETIYLNITPNVKVWFEDLCIFDGIRNTINTGEILRDKDDSGMVHLPISVKKDGRNGIRILCVKEDNKEFSFEYLLSVKRYPKMWANDYLFWARNAIPVPERNGEEGVAISVLLSKDMLDTLDMGLRMVEYQWPPMLSDEENFDFNALCGEGDVCYVYTEVTYAHVLQYSGTVERIYVNGVPVNKEGAIPVEPGDRVLFRCCRTSAGWKLYLNTEKLTLSFLTSARGIGDKAIFAGPFWGTQCHGPEYEWTLSKVFRNQKGQPVYWRFCDGSELRIYLDSVFWGQWFYALMVGFYGIRSAACFLGAISEQRLFCENMSTLAEYFDYIEYDIEKHVMPAFMPRLFEMNVLDNIGTMGMNLLDAYFDSNDKTLLSVIERIRYQAEETIPRFEDGTYYRVDTMWADDLYMSCPFLIRMGRLTGDVEWYEKAKKQIAGFEQRLYMREENLFSHIYFPDEGIANLVPWGRGNGWVMWTLSEFLMLAEGHVDLTAEKELFCRMAHSIRALQDESGLWHQVLNCTTEESYLETSCTGMFLLAFTRGVKYGWLEASFLDCMEKAWKGLLQYSIDKSGNVYGVCMGSGCHMEKEYYFTIPTIINDDHGTGVILTAASEYCSLLEQKTGPMRGAKEEWE